MEEEEEEDSSVHRRESGGRIHAAAKQNVGLSHPRKRLKFRPRRHDEPRTRHKPSWGEKMQEKSAEHENQTVSIG